MQITRIRTDCLNEDTANARLHGEKNLAAIRSSIARWGQVEPLVVQSGTMRVIGGNGRLAVLRGMGIEEVDCVVLDLDATQATALALALNRTGELGAWDPEALGALLLSLNEDGQSIGELGWDEDELEPLLKADWTPDPIEEAESKPAGHTVKFSEMQFASVKAAIETTRRNDDAAADLSDAAAIAYICSKHL